MIQLLEGQMHTFTISGDVKLPDGLKCFKLKDPNGLQHLLPMTGYEEYGFKQGTKIQCCIDKINCTGQIYLEPKHPHYERGNCYDFTLVRIDPGRNDELQAVLKDKLGKDILLPADDLPESIQAGDSVKCKVDRIKRGELFITPCGSEQLLDHYKKGTVISLTLKTTRTYSGNREFYIFCDAAKNRFLIRKKFYRKYGFSTGDVVDCEVKEFEGNRFLEPLHPVFRKGYTYEFIILGEDVITVYPNRKIPVFNLRNPYGKSIVLKKEAVLKENLVDNMVICKVLDVIRSKPVLECHKKTSRSREVVSFANTI